MPAFGGTDQYTKLLLHGDGTDTATFVPDTSGNYTDRGNTVLMLHFDGADAATATTDAATNKAVTFVGTAKISTAQSKFGGSSLLLDGDSDEVTLADSADFAFSSGDFTIEAWCRFSSVTGQRGIVGQWLDDTHKWSFFFDGTKMEFYDYNNGYNIECYSSGWTPSTNTWYHLAVVRYGNNFTIYADGVSIGTSVDGSAMTDYAGTLHIGAVITGGTFQYFAGNIDDFRIVKGKALYTANFTPPTVSPSPKDVTCVGNAQIDTAQKEFGTGSILFDGTGDYLSLADSDDWNFGSGDFTIDCWFMYSADVWFPICNQRKSSQANNSWGINLLPYISGTCYFEFTTDGTTETEYYVQPGVPSKDNWHHFALVRSGNDLKFYIDGIQAGTTKDMTGVTIYNSTRELHIGTNDVQDATGWIDEFRISKGIARWTANFTPPALAYGLNTPRIIIS